MDMGKDYRTQISQKTQKRKVSEEPVSLQFLSYSTSCKLATYLSFYNQYKYCQLAEKYKLLVKLFFGVVGSVLVV